MSNTTPRKSTATVTAEARAAARIGACKLITAAALVAADRATRSLSAAARHPLARDISDERAREDGVWIYLPTGWRCASSDCNAVHEDTVADALECLKRAYFAPDADDLAEIEREAAEAATAASAGNFTAHAAHMARAVRPNPAAVAEAEAAEVRARKRYKRAEAAAVRAWAARQEADETAADRFATADDRRAYAAAVAAHEAANEKKNEAERAMFAAVRAATAARNA